MNSRSTLLILLLAAALRSGGLAQEACGIAWKPPLLVSSDSSVATVPRLAVVGDTIHLCWFGLDTTAGGTLSSAGLRYARSTDGGSSFSAPVTLLSPFESFPGLMVALESGVFIATTAILDTFFGIVLFSSPDGGTSWSSPAAVIPSAYPEILFTAGRGLYLGYREIETSWFGITRSTDGGLTWESVARRIRDLSDVAVSGSVLHAVGQTPGASRIETGHYVSRDSGRSWSGPSLVSPEDLVRSAYPSIAVNDGPNLCAAWIDTGAVVFRFSRNAGVSWGPWQRLTDGPGSVTADLGADGEFVAVLWDRDVGSARGIGGRISNDRGESFCPAMLPASGAGAREPVVVVRDSTLHAAWIDDAAGRGGVTYRRGGMPRNPGGGNAPPSSFVLKQSYPNPTNGVAFIGFDVPAASTAALVIYNVLGEVVFSPPLKSYPPGRYEERVDVGGWPSGVYFYRLAGTGAGTFKKLVVVR